MGWGEVEHSSPDHSKLKAGKVEISCKILNRPASILYFPGAQKRKLRTARIIFGKRI